VSYYFKIFWFLFLIEICVTPFLLIYFYLTRVNLVGLYKIPLLISFAVICVFHLFYKLKWKFISVLFLFFGIVSSIVGAYYNFSLWGIETLSSFYTFLMPVLSISFGVHYARSFSIKEAKRLKIYFVWAFFLSVFAVSSYIYFYHAGLISYYGFGSRLDIVSAYQIAHGSFLGFGLCLLLVVYSGKRATMLMTLLVFILHYSKIFKKFSLKNSFYALVVSFVLMSAGHWAFQNNLFRRFEPILKFDINDKRATYLATGGRWQEVEGVVDFLETNSFMWFTGAGIGATYNVYDVGNDLVSSKAYVHITPVGYIFIYGIVFTLLLYIGFLVLFWLGWRNSLNNVFYIIFVITVLGSIFGANLFVDHKAWFFVGIAYVLCADKKKLLPISQLHLFKKSFLKLRLN